MKRFRVVLFEVERIEEEVKLKIRLLRPRHTGRETVTRRDFCDSGSE